ncbi:MAG: hypothetical protein R6V50_02790 [Thermoplasmatota archaeon]
MSRLSEITNNIKILKDARNVLKEQYEQSDFHKKKERNPDRAVPPSPEDEEIYKLLTAISQLDQYVKKFQQEQFELLKKHD